MTAIGDVGKAMQRAIDATYDAGIAVGRLQELKWMRHILIQAISHTGPYEGVAELEHLQKAVDDKIREVQS